MKNLIIGLILILVGLTAFKTIKIEHKKDINQVWNVDSNTKVFLKNKYGKMDIKAWDKNVVDIRITITVKTKNKKDAEKVFDRIHIEFSEQNNIVKAITKIDSKKGIFSFFNWNSDDYSIDWIVYMPKSNMLKLSNAYGDTYINEMNGELRIDIKYGDLNLEKANNNLKLQLAYGDADIDYCNNANINLKYSEVKIDKAGNLKLDIKYSKMKINHAGNIKMKSKYDEMSLGTIKNFDVEADYGEIEIKKVKNVNLSSKYTEFEADLISGNIVIFSDYGEIDIGSLQKGFERVEISGKYTDVDLKPGSNVYYNGEFSSKYGEISVPKSFHITNTTSKSTREKISGYNGNGNSQSKIIIVFEYGDIEIK